MCRRTAYLRLRVADEFDVPAEERWRTVEIDGCISSLVAAIQAAGIDMRSSCCGHGNREGYIHLSDGRALLVLDKDQADWYFARGPTWLAACLTGSSRSALGPTSS